MPALRFTDPDCCFIRVPKTASTSVIRGFFGGLENAAEVVHGPMPEAWAGLPSFCFVRHPVARFVSAFAMFKSYRVNTAAERAMRARLSVGTVAELLVDETVVPRPGGSYAERAQAARAADVGWLVRPGAGRPGVPLRTAGRSTGGELADYLGRPVPALPHFRRSDAPARLTAADQALVREIYREDFARFGYDTV